METVLGLFEETEDANKTLKTLKEAGFTDDCLSILSREVVLSEDEQTFSTGRAPSHLNMLISEAADNVLGALATLVISNEDTRIYAEGVKQGRVLVVARMPFEKASFVKKVMVGCHASEVQQIHFNRRSTPARRPEGSEENEFYFPLLWKQLEETF